MKPSLLVLAAGMGSRYGGLKQVDPVGPSEEKILDYSVYDAVRSGFGKIVFVIRKEIEKDFKDLVSSKYERRIPTDYVFQELDKLPPGFSVLPGRTKPWGTAHAILVGREKIDGPFAVINADDFYGRNAFEVLGAHLAKAGNPADHSMVGYSLKNTLSEHGEVSRGICAVSKEGFLESVVERTKIGKIGSKIEAISDKPGEKISLSGEEIVSLNLWGFTPQIFKDLEAGLSLFLKNPSLNEKSEFQIPTVVNELLHSGKARVRVLTSRDRWFGVTYREDKPGVVSEIAKLVSSREYPTPLWS